MVNIFVLHSGWIGGEFTSRHPHGLSDPRDGFGGGLSGFVNIGDGGEFDGGELAPVQAGRRVLGYTGADDRGDGEGGYRDLVK